MSSTPGPWIILPPKTGIPIASEDFKFVIIPDDGNGRHRDGLYGIDICTMPRCHLDAEGNAHLIASAPDLLQACKFILENVDLLDLSIVKAAVAKAEGKHE